MEEGTLAQRRHRTIVSSEQIEKLAYVKSIIRKTIFTFMNFFQKILEILYFTYKTSRTAWIGIMDDHCYVSVINNFFKTDIERNKFLIKYKKFQKKYKEKNYGNS